MSEIIKIRQQPISVDEILIKDEGQSITFFDLYLLIESSGQWNIIDHNLGLPTKVFLQNRIVFGKNDFIHCLYLKTDIEKWIVSLDAKQDRDSGHCFIFDNYDECLTLFNKIVDWRFKN